MKKPSAAKHLSQSSKAIWRKIVADYLIDEPAALLLTHVFEMRDRREEARLQIAKHGAVYQDRFGQPKASPWVAVERDAGLAMGRSWRLLGFDQQARGPEL